MSRSERMCVRGGGSECDYTYANLHTYDSMPVGSSPSRKTLIVNGREARPRYLIISVVRPRNKSLRNTQTLEFTMSFEAIPVLTRMAT